MGSERRVQTRYNMNLPVKIYNENESEVLDVAKAVDISAGGLKMHTTNFFKPEQGLLLKFLINSESSAAIPVQVIWSEDENGDRRCGVRFLNS